jgi:hypothetical protein
MLQLAPSEPATPVIAATSGRRPPSATALAIVGIPVGLLALLACVLLSLALGVPPSGNNPAELALRTDVLITIWNWTGTIGAGVTATLILLGSIDCLRDRPSGPKLLRLSAWAAVVLWALAMLVWIVYTPAMINAAVAARQSGGGRGVGAGGASSSPESANALAWFIGALTYRTLLTWAWAAAVWTVLSARQPRPAQPGAEECQAAGGSLAEAIALPAAAAAATPAVPHAALQYRSATSATAGTESLVAGAVLARLLFLAGLAIGLLFAATAAQDAFERYVFYRASQRRIVNASPFTGNVPEQQAIDPLVWLTTQSTTAAAALALAVGSVLALRRVRGGRIVVIAALAVWLFADTTQLCLSTIPRYLRMGPLSLAIRGGAPSARQSSTAGWSLLLVVTSFLRAQLYAVICFVALRRRNVGGGA